MSPQPALSESITTEPLDLDTSSPYSLHRAVYSRRAEYVRPHQIRVKVGTWNVAARSGTDKDLARWFVDGDGIDTKLLPSADHLNHKAALLDDVAGSDAVHVVGGDKIGLYVLGLQEIVDLNTASSYYMSRVYTTDNRVVDKWRAALEAALPTGYTMVDSVVLYGMLLLTYASPEVTRTISNVSSTSVGTGVMGLGNKGSVATRIMLGETTRLVFVNCHLASGDEYKLRRVSDAQNVIKRSLFPPISPPASGVKEEDERISDADFTFCFGDLNFRLEGLPGDDIRRLLLLHARGEYGADNAGREDCLEGDGVVVKLSVGSEETDDESTSEHGSDSSVSLPDEDPPDPHNDPESLQATLDSLLPHDQLRHVRRNRQVFHDGWHEGPITFLPTYKYDVGTVGLFDSSEKRRAPSWCDRILYRTRRDMEEYGRRIKEEEEARKRDEEMKALGIDQAGEDDVLLFDVYDPENDGDDQAGEAGGDDKGSAHHDADGEQLVTREGFTDRIRLDLYTSHQRITSSDHKPVVSLFTLEYDAVVAELKTKIYAEVARELDRVENEGRPVVTIVVDSRDGGSIKPSDAAGASVDMGEIRFLQQTTSSLTVANTGRVPASFSFLQTPRAGEDGAKMRRWLETTFVRSHLVEGFAEELGENVRLEPGETVKANLDMCIDDVGRARMLNQGKCLDDVLVLRVSDGRDHFVPVRAAWSPTCIGRSVDELIRVPDGGIRAFAKSLTNGKTASICNDMHVHNAAPKELFRLTEAADVLTDRVLADEQMLEEYAPRDAGWPFDEASWRYKDKDSRRRQMANIVDSLDRDRTVNEAFTPETPAIERLELVGQVLLLFLRGLTDGIIPCSLWSRIEAAAIPSIQGPATPRLPTSTQEEVLEDDRGAVLDILGSAPNHNISFVFLTTMLAKMIAELVPLTKGDLAMVAKAGSSTGAFLGKRPLSFRRMGPSPEADAMAALDRRMAKERRFGEIFGKLVCRAPVPERDGERRNLEERQRAALELFLRKRGDG